MRRLNVERVAFGRMGRARVASEDAYGPALEGQPRVIAALAALPRRQREVAVLHYYLDLSVADVARSLQVSEGTVKTCLHRARASLRVRLTEERADGEEVGHGRS